ncbi:MAG: DUF3341 domain-containing protein [Bacteroidia bacterium]
MSKKIIYGVFEDEEVLLSSAKVLRSKGVRINDVFSPFPIHGLDPVIGIKPTRLSNAAFFYGLFGTSFAVWMTWYMLISDWPMNIGGKPNFLWIDNMPAFIPVTFELTVFCAAHGMVLSYLLVNKIYPGRKPHNPDLRSTDDKFIMEIQTAQNGKIGEDSIMSTLRETGAVEINQQEL